MLKFIQKNCSIVAILFSLFLSFFATTSAAVNFNASEGNLFSDIEKSLIFDQSAKGSFSRAKGGQSKININSGDDVEAFDNDSSNNKIDMVVVDADVKSMDIAEKEKLAYNAAVIGQYEVAIELCKQILAEDKENLYAKFSLAVVYQKIGQLGQAKVIYKDLLKTNPERRKEVVINLLNILIDESPKEAIYMLSRLSAENPNSAYIASQSAIAYDKAGMSQRAIEAMQKAIRLDAENLMYVYNLAVMYDKAERYREAVELYGSFAKQYSGDEVSLDQVRDRMKYIRNKVE